MTITRMITRMMKDVSVSPPPTQLSQWGVLCSACLQKPNFTHCSQIFHICNICIQYICYYVSKYLIQVFLIEITWGSALLSLPPNAQLRPMLSNISYLQYLYSIYLLLCIKIFDPSFPNCKKYISEGSEWGLQTPNFTHCSQI